MKGLYWELRPLNRLAVAGNVINQTQAPRFNTDFLRSKVGTHPLFSGTLYETNFFSKIIKDKYIDFIKINFT